MSSQRNQIERSKYCIHTVQDEEKSMMFLLDLNIS